MKIGYVYSFINNFHLNFVQVGGQSVMASRGYYLQWSRGASCETALDRTTQLVFGVRGQGDIVLDS